MHLRAVIPLKAKSDTFEAFKAFKVYAENHHNVKIKALCDDKSGEYMSNAFLQFTTDAGIERQHTVRNRPQQNGVAESANRTIAEGLTAMLSESGLPLSFWGEALASYVHVWNCLPTASIAEATTPYALWHGKKPDVLHFRVWGCTAYVHVQKDQRKGLGAHMQKCVFIGYPVGYKGWKFWDTSSKRCLISERADFDERYFPMRKDTPPLQPSLVDVGPSISEFVPAQEGRLFDDSGSEPDTTPPVVIPPIVPDPIPVAPVAPATPPSLPSTPSRWSRSPTPSPSPSPAPGPSLRRSSRERRAPGEWWKVQHREPTPIIESSE